MTLAGLGVLLTLGGWQVHRLNWKNELIAAREARLVLPAEPLPAQIDDPSPWDFRRVEVTGRFDHEHEVLFGVGTHRQALGHQLLTPLIRSDGVAVLIDRGWIPADHAHPATRPDGQITGEVTVAGIARNRSHHRRGWFTPDNQPGDGIWYSYDLAALGAALDLELLAIVVEADATPVPGDLPIGGRTRIELPNPHFAYALTWFALAAALLAVYLAFSFRR